MAKFIANLLVLAIAVVLILLSVESTSALQYFGYGFGGLLFIASVLNWNRASKS